MCDPILVTIENATPLESIQSWKCDPSSGTSPIISPPQHGYEMSPIDEAFWLKLCSMAPGQGRLKEILAYRVELAL